MGVVYEAFDRERQATVALKLLHGAQQAARERLHQEFAALRSVAAHPNLVDLGQLCDEDGHCFFTMELVAGADFVEHVRPGGRLDEARLRDGLAQLTRGLMALHAAGMVHRDVKPSNVKVGADGRVVLLDFGLVVAADHAAGPLASGDDVGAVGTLAYMAPEQALGRPVGPEADWYSVGVMLYEALLGDLPIDGPALQLIVDKQRLTPVPPRARVAALPADLDRMCVELLDFEPARRPSGRSLLRRLGVGLAAQVGLPSPFLPPSTHTQTELFVGREAELGILASALADTRAGRPITVHVQGEAGIGKSFLVRSFVDRLAAETPDLVTLTARCHEQPLAPYPGLSGIVDALARHLERLPRAQVAALVPERASLLVDCFPVLKRVDALADARACQVLDPQERRMRVFALLRELMRRLGQRCTLVLVIDDLQWADADALALLGELLRPPEAARFLLLTSWRESADAASVRERLARLPGETRAIGLGPLPRDAATELAAVLLTRAGDAASVATIDPDDLATRAAGQPLLLDELVRATILDGPHLEAQPSLAALLAARVARLEATPRQLLELVALAGGPLPLEALARAAGVDAGAAQRQLAALEVARLARSSPDAGTVELAHDGVRAALLYRLAPEQRAARHRDLARQLEASGRGAPHELVHHHRSGGLLERAAHHAERAAQVAAAALAFEQAARFFALAVELLPALHASRRPLELAHADALAHAGRGADAAQAYLGVVAGAGAAEALELKHRAAQQLLVAGHIDEAIATMRDFLGQEGVSYPSTPMRAIMSILASTARLRLGGMKVHASAEQLASAKELTRLDACFHAGGQLAMVDTIRARALTARGLVLALRAAEPYRLSRALALEASHESALGGTGVARSRALLTSAEQLARTVANPHALGYVDGVRAHCAFLAGEFRAARVQCAAAEAVLSERCTGAGHELKVLRLWSCGVLRFLGEYAALARRTSEVLRECQQRGDLHGVSSLRTSDHPFVLLAADEPTRARAEILDALRSWPSTGFRVQDYFAMFAQAAVAHYQDDHARAHALLLEKWPALRRSLLLQVQFVRIVMFHERGAAALAVAHSSSASERKRLLAAARADARRVEREPVPWAQAHAALLHAQIAAVHGDADATRVRLDAAISACAAADMGAHVAAARRCLGRLLGGDEGHALVSGADAWMSAQEIKRPERMTTMLLPGFAW